MASHRGPPLMIWASLLLWLMTARILHHNFIVVVAAPTALSGFGSRSAKNTIFRDISANVTASENAFTKVTTPQSIADAVFSKESHIVTTRPKAWAKRSKEPDLLWIQTRNEKGLILKTYEIKIINEEGDWQIDEINDSICNEDNRDNWVAIEGIYGFYRLPSGLLWILVTKTLSEYTAPSTFETKVNAPWWQIRRVQNLEMVHLSNPNMMMSASSLKEEIRQLRHLRQSLKDHNLYFVDSQESMLIRDMTRNLQDSLSLYLDEGHGTGRNWWESSDEVPDPRFFWNMVAVDPLLKKWQSEGKNGYQQSPISGILSLTVPLTSAFVGIQRNVTDVDSGMRYDHLLISRRSRFRAGTRFTRRGADATGAVANFVETEQICLTHNGTSVQNILSHVQTRGSIPLRWSSPADVKTYRPRVRIGINPLAQARALRLHLLDQFAHYVRPLENGKKDNLMANSTDVARLIFVNLIDKHKDQGRLGRAFDSVLKAVMDIHKTQPVKEDLEKGQETPLSRVGLYDLHKSSDSNEDISRDENDSVLSDPRSVQHVWFDFHAEVKDGRWDRLKKLLDELSSSLESHGSFRADFPTNLSNWTIHERQTSIVRTNCMDCLDRTNVVQSLFGRYILFRQLQNIESERRGTTENSSWADYKNRFHKDPTTLPWQTGEHAHRLLWADNADAISRLYAGTAALKGDFTRTGERTKRGALNDGVNSLQRYYLNNFLDAGRQEGMDLLVGHVDFANVGNNVLTRDMHRDEDKFVSIKEAATNNFFGKLIGQMDDNEAFGEQDATTFDEEFQNSVDLRWISGDLQSHMLNDANLLLNTANDDKEKSSIFFDFEYTASKALSSMDRRSTSDLPWWADSVAHSVSASHIIDRGMSESNEISTKSSDETRIMNKYQGLYKLEPSQLLGIILIGLRAPTGLALTVVALMLVVFFSDVF